MGPTLILPGLVRDKNRPRLSAKSWGPSRFRPVRFEPSWRTPVVVALATTIYEERWFNEMPILADALEEVEADEEIVRHLRQKEAGHFRGCWCLDLVLGRK
jgi:hypothetical protein